MTAKGGCYIDVWRDENFKGEMIRIEGPAEYPRLSFAQGDWGDCIGSLRVGPNAFVIAYRDENFGDRRITLGPLDEVADLSALKFDDEIDSMHVIDSLKIFDRLEYNQSHAGVTDADERRGKDKGKKGRGR